MIATAAAAAGLLALAACGKPAPTTSVENDAAMTAAAIEAKADNLEAMAGSASNDMVAAMLAGADANLGDGPANTADPVTANAAAR